MLSKAATTAISLVEKSPEIVRSLQKNCDYLHQQLSKISVLQLIGQAESAVKHLCLAESTGERIIDKDILWQIVKLAEDEGVALTLAAYLEEEEHLLPPPSIKVCVSSELGCEEMDLAVRTIAATSQHVLSAVQQASGEHL